MYIVEAQQAESEQLFRHEQVPQVGAGEARTRDARARIVKRRWVEAKGGVLDVASTGGGEKRTGATHAGGRDAVKHIDAARHAFHEIFRKADAHEVSRAVGRERCIHHIEHGVHVRFCFANGQSANAEANPIAALVNGFARSPPERGVDAALHNREERLIGRWRVRIVALQTLEFGLASRQPPNTAFHRFTRERFGRLPGYHVIELHNDIRAQIAFNTHHGFWRELVERPVKMTFEFDAIFGDGAKPFQRKHLKAARVGKNRLVPRHESMKATHRTNSVIRGPEVQMVRIGEDHCRTEPMQIVGIECFDGRQCPDWHELRCFDNAVRRDEVTSACGARLVREVE